MQHSIKKAFIQKTGRGLDIEEELLVRFFEKKSIPYSLYTKKDIQRRRLPLSRETLVAGDLDSVHGALRQLEIPPPQSNSYPSSLSSLLYRRIWTGTLQELRTLTESPYFEPVFVKPKSLQKRFTGRVVSSGADLYFFHDVSKHTEILYSEVVEWISEYRVYIIDSEIRHIAHYDGDPDVPISMEVVKEAVESLDRSGESYAAYGIDFGVLKTWETALIEMNDGYALGAYKMKDEDYGELIVKRWLELVA